jgi:hypothetical protein
VVNRRRGVAVIGAALAILALAGGYLYVQGGSTPVSVDAAVKQFRDTPTTRVVSLSSAAATAQAKQRPMTGAVARTRSAALALLLCKLAAAGTELPDVALTLRHAARVQSLEQRHRVFP